VHLTGIPSFTTKPEMAVTKSSIGSDKHGSFMVACLLADAGANHHQAHRNMIVSLIKM
jgi:hypothetical protein